jgi:hypothetical protein
MINTAIVIIDCFIMFNNKFCGESSNAEKPVAPAYPVNPVVGDQFFLDGF